MTQNEHTLTNDENSAVEKLKQDYEKAMADKDYKRAAELKVLIADITGTLEL